MTGRPRRGSVCLFLRPTLPARAMMTARMFGVSGDSIYGPYRTNRRQSVTGGPYPASTGVTQNPTCAPAYGMLPADRSQAYPHRLRRCCARLVTQEAAHLKPRLHDRRYRRGMTFIEMMIVISILGIMGALVYPYFQYSTDTADENVHKQELRITRMAIQMYQIQ